MALGTYKSIEEVARKHQISVLIEPFIQSLPIAIDERFQQELTYVIQHVDVKMSEAAVSEFLIAPILRGNLETLRRFAPVLESRRLECG